MVPISRLMPPNSPTYAPHVAAIFSWCQLEMHPAQHPHMAVGDRHHFHWRSSQSCRLAIHRDATAPSIGHGVCSCNRGRRLSQATIVERMREDFCPGLPYAHPPPRLIGCSCAGNASGGRAFSRMLRLPLRRGERDRSAAYTIATRTRSTRSFPFVPYNHSTCSCASVPT